ncbi:hypothetical protein CC79DRAFT_1371914 [Sarocladium strictum]
MDEAIRDSSSEAASLSHSSDESDEEQSIDAYPPIRSQLRPHGSSLTFVPYAEWDQSRSYNGEPVICYNLEWKVSAKNRRQAGESETNIAVSPKDLWKHILQRKVAEASARKPWRKEKTLVVLSINTRPATKVTKEYPKLDVNWRFIAEQLQDWSSHLTNGKAVNIAITFHFESVDQGKTGRGGATANQQADLDARTVGLSRGACIQKAYAFVRCSGPSCMNQSDHCWQYEGRHIMLRPHHIRILADHLLAGHTLNTHEDVPEEFRRLAIADERDRRERQQRERTAVRRSKRRRRDSSGSIIETSLCHRCSRIDTQSTQPQLAFPTTPILQSDISREDAVERYTLWQQSRVRTEKQKNHYRNAEFLTLERYWDLDLIASNQQWMFDLYRENDIPEGVAWHYVCDVKHFLKLQQGSQSI